LQLRKVHGLRQIGLYDLFQLGAADQGIAIKNELLDRHSHAAVRLKRLCMGLAFAQAWRWQTPGL
jgi:hypothetical protein